MSKRIERSYPQIIFPRGLFFLFYFYNRNDDDEWCGKVNTWFFVAVWQFLHEPFCVESGCNVYAYAKDLIFSFLIEFSTMYTSSCSRVIHRIVSQNAFRGARESDLFPGEDSGLPKSHF